MNVHNVMYVHVHMYLSLEFNRKFKWKGITDSRILYKTDTSRRKVTGYKQQRPRNHGVYSREG